MNESNMGKELWVRLQEGRRNYINLRYQALGRDSNEVERKIKAIFATYGNPQGVFTYVSFENGISMRAVRSREIKDMHVGLLEHHQDAPLQGILITGDYTHNLKWSVHVGSNAS